MKDVIIVGASGHGKVVADIIIKSGDKVLGFLDDNPRLQGGDFIGFSMLGRVDDYATYRENAEFIIAIGNASVREKVASKMEGVRWYRAIHPRAIIASDESNGGISLPVGEGTVIMANAVINPGATIGRHCIINTGAIVEHDNTVEDFAHISVGAKLAGTVHIGKSTWVGIGACVSNNISICDHCMIGAGAVVINDIEESGTYVGVPARKVK